MKRDALGIVAGFSAIIVTMLILVRSAADMRMVMGSLFLIVACFYDTLWARIPNWANFALLSMAFVYSASSGGIGGAAQSALGATAGFAIFLVPYLMGGMGGGDVKALAALGALVGPASILQVAIYTALVGGVLSLLHYACGPGGAERLSRWRVALVAYAATRSVECLRPQADREPLRFPYAAAIAAGFLVYVQRGSVW